MPQIIIFLSPDGEILAEAPGINGAPRRKISTVGVTWPPEILAELQSQAADERSRHAAMERERRHSTWDFVAKRRGASGGEAYADTIVGPRRKDAETTFQARPHGTVKWKTITVRDETPTMWCIRNHWELGKTMKPERDPFAEIGALFVDETE